MPLKSPTLQEWSDAADAQLARMKGNLGALTPEQFNFKPAPEKWSVGECLDHLNTLMRLYNDAMGPILEASSDRTGGEPFGRGTFMGRMLVNSLRKPAKRFKAPGVFEPSHSELDPEGVRAEFETEVGRMKQLIQQSDGLAIGKIKMSSPAMKLMKLTLAQALESQVIHNNRHLAQAERVTQHKNFPAG
jgi:hypothetical protein